MNDAKALVRRLREVASKLKSASKWNGSGLAVDAASDDFLYELYCYFRAALAVHSHFTICVSGATTLTKGGKPVAKWPKKPAYKGNFSYLSLLDPRTGIESLQLCPGIRIRDMHGKDRAPDINLLKADAPDYPIHDDVLCIWDAKFTSKDGTKLPDIAVSDFVFTYQQLGSPKPSKQWVQNVKEVEWESPGLLTNALPSTEPDATLATHGVRETSQYPDGPPKTRP